MKKYFFPTLGKFRVLEYVILLYATVLGMTLEGLVFVFNKAHF